MKLNDKGFIEILLTLIILLILFMVYFKMNTASIQNENTKVVTNTNAVKDALAKAQANEQKRLDNIDMSYSE